MVGQGGVGLTRRGLALHLVASTVPGRTTIHLAGLKRREETVGEERRQKEERPWWEALGEREQRR